MTLISRAGMVGLVSFSYIASALSEAVAQPAATQPTVSAQTLANDPVAVMPPEGLVPENVLFLDTSKVAPKSIFLADKKNRTLTVWSYRESGFVLAGAYPMDIGKKDGDKTLEGDHRTPEGIYFFQERLDGPGLDFNEYGQRAFTLDYPNFFDQRAKKTGNGIWLHAVPNTKSLLRGSRGCVVVRNDIIDKLTPLISVKATPMLILDKVNYVPRANLETQKRTLSQWLESWRKAWESKDIETYMGHYGDSFTAMKMKKSQWRQYKEGLNNKYSAIRVHVTEPFFLAKGDDAVISFIQSYESDAIQDVGEKVLYLKKVGDKFEILTEIWRPLDSDLLAQKKTAEAKIQDN